VGKTHICALLAQTFAAQDTVTYCKPVQTGGLARANGTLAAPDFEQVKLSPITILKNENLHVPYCFKLPCSPHLAAQRAGANISFVHIKKCLAALRAAAAITIVEGAGGVMVPLGRGRYMADLMAALTLPIILVTTPRLGTLNHTLLSIQQLQCRKLALAGVIMNNVQNLPQDYIYQENAAFIARAIAPVPFMSVAYNHYDQKRWEQFAGELRKNHS
jgi:dethiobiotin synthase